MTKPVTNFLSSKPVPLTQQDVLKLFVFSDLNALKEFSDEVEFFLDKKLSAHDARSQEILSKQDPATKQVQMMFLSGGYQKYGSQFPDTLRYSLFVHIFAQVEHSLDVICSYVQETNKLELSPKDLHGDVLTRSKIYLTKVAKTGFPKTLDLIQTLRVLGFVRNLIVHANGLILESYDKGKRQAIVSYFKKSKTAELVNDTRIHLKREFCPAVIKVLESFFSELFFLLKM